jgi:hypothetical protein
MRLNVPTDITAINLVGGPGTTELLEALLDLQGQHEENRRRNMSCQLYPPKLRFTGLHPDEQAGLYQPIAITVEMYGMRKEGDYYVIDAGIGEFQDVTVKYRINKDENGQCGTLADRS